MSTGTLWNIARIELAPRTANDSNQVALVVEHGELFLAWLQEH